MHFILTPLGSAGDVYPFLWVAERLLERGHRVSVITSELFEREAIAAGAEVHPLGGDEDYDRLTRHPDLWHPSRAIRLVGRVAGDSTGPLFEAIRGIGRTGPAVLVGSILALGARVARERLGLPLATLHLQPSCLMSLHDTPVLFAGLEWLTRLPRVVKRTLLALPNPMDRAMRPGVVAACNAAGVPPPRRIVPDWFHSPDLVLGLFPDWFAAPQPDWPPNTRLAGFPLTDQGRLFPVTDGLRRFLREGPPPVVITAGSAMRQGAAFFAAAVEACAQLDRRMVLVTRHPEQLPARTSASVFVAEYAPFGSLLPEAAAFLNHGGDRHDFPRARGRCAPVADADGA